MSKTAEATAYQQPKTLIVGIYAPHNRAHIESYFEEFVNLVHSNSIEEDASLFIKLREIDPGYFLTKGKLGEIQELCKKEGIQQIILSEPLSLQQERNLTDLLRCRVVDRTLLILEIFQKGAQSAEGKLQVEMAMFRHQKARLAGKGIGLSQQSGRTGTRGPGETAKEKETQHLERLMTKLRRDLEHLQRVRETQRKQRIKSGTALLCLIGYTNAGKSTILNALTKSSVLAEDKLFATLDTTTRELYIDKQKKGILSDTVGFIQQLPHHLVEAFKSTLSELQYADLLLHVIDSSDPNWLNHVQVVHEVLEELGVNKPMLYIFNKTDKISDKLGFERESQKFNPRVMISATEENGLAELIEYLAIWKPA